MSPVEDDPSNCCHPKAKPNSASHPAQHPIVQPPQPSSSIFLHSRGNVIYLQPQGSAFPTTQGREGSAPGWGAPGGAQHQVLPGSPQWRVAFCTKNREKKQNYVIGTVFQLLVSKVAGLGETPIEDAIAMILRSRLGEMHGCHGGGGSKN